MNNWVGIGRITREPELRIIAGSEKAVCNMNLAVSRPFKKDETDFFRVVVFGKAAENCDRYLGKGSMIGVQGRLQNNNYEDKNGVKHYGMDIIADRVEFLDTKRKEDSDLPEGFKELPIDDDEEIPF